MNSMRVILVFIGFLLWFSSCQKDPKVEQPVRFYVPSNFPEPVYRFHKNPLTQEGFNLGRKLFYDPILSRDSTISCGSCHQQFVAFAHAGHSLSHGIEDRFGIRNAPGIFNAAWHKSFMWDGGVNHLEVMPTAPIGNPLEMDETMANVVRKLNRSEIYRKWFKAAFGTDLITDRLMLLALAQFMGAMVSANSKYDKYVRGEPGGNFSEQEKRGLELFRAKCASCHSGELFTDYSFRNNGLDTEFNKDKGRALITALKEDEGKFVVPSLRNVELTAPYMHDGRFWTLEQVLEHYEKGVKISATLDPLLVHSNGKTGISMTPDEKTQIIAFLKTLTDWEFVNDKRFAEP
ncbi:MAG: cytochrome c peroxidase [Chitinophagales bacterium]|nr:c-type cytochrome [Chitinophagales bacterium]MDW8273093.1 cytochrome c peroxidase [Chitinophagales bacterium]